MSACGATAAEELDVRSISFCCGGWLEFYLFGVAKGLEEYRIHKGIPLLGCSAGALTAAGLACEGDFDASIEYCKEKLVPTLYSCWSGPFQLQTYVSECLDACANLKDWHKIPPDHLQVAYTSLPWFKRERATTFTSHEDLKKCLMASAAAFPFSKLMYHRGNWNGDGGFTDLQPVLDEHTITVSPFYFMNTDIKPSRYVPLWWALFPPNSPAAIDWVYDLGYKDAVEWIKERSRNMKIEKNIDSRRKRSDSQRSLHPFDIPRQISVHRFLGFDVANLTHSSVSMLMDFCLYLLLLFVWKPIAITMIYMELFVKVVILAAATLLYEAYDLLPMIFVGWAFLPPQKTVQLWVYSFTGAAKLAVAGPAQGSHMGDLWDCIRCMFSFSLLKRYLPTSLSKLSADPLKKHVHLNKSSLVYRLVRHFV